MSRDEVREHLAAYSLDALEARERDAVDDHLTRCPDCVRELCELQAVASRLGLALPEADLPTGAKDRMVARALEGERWTLSHEKRVWPRLAVPRFAPAAWAAGVSLIVALSTSLWAAGLQVQLNEQRAIVASLRGPAARYDQIVSVLQAPDVQLRALQGSELAPSAIGRVYVDPQTGAGMMVVRSVPPLSEGRAYQLWCVRPDGTRESGGLLKHTDLHGNGYAPISCPGPLATWQRLGITEEPAAGSSAPTGQRVLGGTV